MSFGANPRVQRAVQFTLHIKDRFASFFPGNPDRGVSIVSLLMELHRSGQFMGAQSLDYRVALDGVDSAAALGQVSTTLTHPQASVRWNVNPTPYPIFGRANALALHCATRYSFAPPAVDIDGITTPLLNMRCEVEPDQTGRVALTLAFDDQFGWVFPEVHSVIANTVEYLRFGLQHFGSLAGPFALVSRKWEPFEALQHALAIADARKLS
jgi:hypothetical protein